MHETLTLNLIPQKLRQYRTNCKLNHNQVARVIGRERSTYTRIETGKSAPSMELLLDLSRIYNVSFLELIGYEAEPSNNQSRIHHFAAESIYELSRREQDMLVCFRFLPVPIQQQLLELAFRYCQQINLKTKKRVYGSDDFNKLSISGTNP